LIDVDTHGAVFTWVQQRLVAAGLLKGKTIVIDGTTLEANTAIRSIRPARYGGKLYCEALLIHLAHASGIKAPTRKALVRLDRKRKKKTSNKDWTRSVDPGAKATKMKDGQTPLARKAEHAVDLETRALIASCVQGADEGDTTTLIETAMAAAEQLEAAQAAVDAPQSLEEIVGDEGYHSNQSMVDLEAFGIRYYVSEPDWGRRDWSKEPEAQAPVYRNRRRIRGRRGRRLMQATWRADRTLIRASLRYRRHASHSSAGAPEHPQTVADPCRRLQSGLGPAGHHRGGHRAWRPGRRAYRYCHTVGPRGSGPTPLRRDRVAGFTPCGRVASPQITHVRSPLVHHGHLCYGLLRPNHLRAAIDLNVKCAAARLTLVIDGARSGPIKMESSANTRRGSVKALSI
jgi:hypothetical protein